MNGILNIILWLSCISMVLFGTAFHQKKEKQWSSQMKLLGSFLAKRLPQNNCEPVSLLSSL
jgi:ABC-type transport system involved in cytochrome bd biosynthesis fused ATPase/permease subunit